MANKRVCWKSFTGPRVIKVSLIVILIIGLLVSGIKARGRIPAYPQDLTSYIGGFFAFADGGDPYDIEFVRGSLNQRTIDTAVDQYVYSPPFLIAFFPLYFVPYSLYRIIWIVSSLLAAWAALCLLALRLKGLHSLLFAVMGTLFFTISATLHDSLFWGQVTPFMVLALSIVVYREFKGALAGIASVIFPLIKPGFSPLTLFVKGKRSLYSLFLMLFVLLISGAAIFGPMSYVSWFGSIRTIGRDWSTACENNLSIARGVSICTETWFPEIDEQRALLDPEYRLQMAEILRNSRNAVYYTAVLLMILLIAVKLAAGKRSGRTLKRDSLLSVAVLFLLVFIPFLWVHYGLFMIYPLWTLLRRGNVTAAVLFFISALFWGMPICMPGFIGSIDWLRFLIPLYWMVYFLYASERSPVLVPSR